MSTKRGKDQLLRLHHELIEIEVNPRNIFLEKSKFHTRQVGLLICKGNIRGETTPAQSDLQHVNLKNSGIKELAIAIAITFSRGVQSAIHGG